MNDGPKRTAIDADIEWLKEEVRSLKGQRWWMLGVIAVPILNNILEQFQVTRSITPPPPAAIEGMWRLVQGLLGG